MLNEGVGSWPYRRARLAGTKTAIVFRGARWTYGELCERVARLGSALRSYGIGKNDRVAFLGMSHPGDIEGLFASGLLGAIFVPLDARLSTPEVEYCLVDSGAAVLIHSAETADIAVPAAKGAGTPTRIMLDGRQDLAAVDSEQGTADAVADGMNDSVTLDDPCLISYASGTASRPRGVVLTHGNVVFGAMNSVLDLDLLGDEVALVCSPQIRAAEMHFVTLPTLLKGGTVILEEAFDAGNVLRAIEQDRVTHMLCVPATLDLLSRHPQWTSTDVSSLRRVVVETASLPRRLLREYLGRGIRICQAYGLTELACGALVLVPSNIEQKLGTAGVPHFFTDVRVADSDGLPVGWRQQGEIQIKGPAVMSAYWNGPDATREAFTREGWLRSGDVGTTDEDGFVTVVERSER